MHSFVILLAVLVTASAVSAFDIPFSFDRDNSDLELSEKACKCKNGRCVTDNRGKTKCACKSGYALQDDETCEVCDCGNKGKCLFTLQRNANGIVQYEKKCLCDKGYAPKDGYCVECVCGENSKCEFENGVKNCYCIEGYSERHGVCTKCDCGDFGECKFVNGDKQCTCDENYLVNNGKCEECNCGSHGTCSFQNGIKVCSCFAGYKVKQGICEKCDCGYFGLGCHYEGQKKVCQCRSNDAQRYGICEECGCGDHSSGCTFDGEKKYCKCERGYVQKGQFCEVGCGVLRQCENGGQCDRGFCKCLTGTSGEFCENIDQCPHLCPNKRDSICSYDPSRQKAYCKCRDETLKYDPTAIQCKKSCDQIQCRNGGTCDKSGESGFCRCPPGTRGDLCEVVDDCLRKDFCGEGAKCYFDVRKGKAACACNDPKLAYDEQDRKCKRSCSEDLWRCENGGNCVRTLDYAFCRCLDKTSGDMCEIVDDCAQGKLSCGNDAECVYDVSKRKASCACIDPAKSYHPLLKQCKKTCDENKRCNNGGECAHLDDYEFCKCPPGTSGDLCEVVDECVSNKNKCKDNAICYFNVATGKAACRCRDSQKKYDVRRERCIVTCDETRRCKNGGLCPTDGSDFCNCREGTSGDLCEIVDDCQKGLCGFDKSVKCTYDIQNKVGKCGCHDASLKYDPTTKTCKVCDCGKNAIACNFQNGKKVCTCPDAFAEKNGRCEKIRCIEKSCTNGRCVIVNGEEVCKCFEGFELEKDYCKRLNCSNTVCHKGTCVVRYGNVEECVCPAGYSLYKHTCLKGNCRVNTCFGGRCETIDGERICICPEGYHLQGIGCFATVCEKRRCFGGWCVVENNKEICTCHEGYVLVNDVCKLVLCKTKSCFGGTCKVVDGEEVCTCPPGYTLHQDVCRLGG